MIRVGSIRNFAWIAPSLLARGEQPKSRDYQKLRRMGIGTILSLRETEASGELEREAYRAVDEGKYCAAAGLAFRHIPCVDKFLPEPKAIAFALTAIDEELADGRPVFMHCLYGVGRTGLVAAAWGMARAGQSLREAGDMFFDFFNDMYIRNGIAIEKYEAHHREYRVLAHWWAVRTMATALGLPTNAPDPFPPEPPANALDWESSCHRALEQWRHSINHPPRGGVESPVRLPL
jgi:protein-tyrosine phosphatase